MKRLFFSSYHNYLDSFSGAAISTREILRYLARSGWDVRVLCGPLYDSVSANETVLYSDVQKIAPRFNLKSGFMKFQGRSTTFKTLQFSDDGIQTTIFLPEGAYNQTPRHFLPRNHGDAFLALFIQTIREFHPEIYSSYGGYWAALRAARFARAEGVKNVFFLHNLSYERVELFELFDLVIVPSQFAADYYRERLGINPIVIPPLIDENRFKSDLRAPKYLTFINPSVEKGLPLVVEIANELSRKRPDIPLLVVGGRTPLKPVQNLPQMKALANVSYSPGASDPRAIYDVTRLLLVPSLCEETFGRVVIEAAFNGIPSLCSNRGALPEVMGNLPEMRKLVLPLSETWRSCRIGEVERAETRCWLETILTIWDNDILARELSEILKTNAELYSYNSVANAITQRLLMLVNC